MNAGVDLRPLRSALWERTSDGAPRGTVTLGCLEELWIHTGTHCNLACPTCLEGSKPGDSRLERITFPEVRPFIDEAVRLGVRKISLTGGEPFAVRDTVRILDYALEFVPCLVLTNGTDPLIRRMEEISPLKDRPHRLFFRVSLDASDPRRHDAIRGPGMFEKAIEGIRLLRSTGFPVSVATRVDEEEGFPELLRRFNLPADLVRVSFPELHPPGVRVGTPEISEHCMEAYQTEKTRAEFMCARSRMVLRTGGRLRVYACTLVDDDSDYDLGGSLSESLSERVALKHHRCYACFSRGTSCSESSGETGTEP